MFSCVNLSHLLSLCFLRARGLYYVNIARKPADKWRVMKWKNGTVLMSVNQVEDKEAKVVGPNDSLRMTET